MNHDSYLLNLTGVVPDPSDQRPLLLVPHVWIGDFVRAHSVVRVLNWRWPNRPLDMLSSSLCAPLVDYMPGVRSGIVFDLPRGSLAIGRQRALANQLRERNYGTAIVLLSTLKSALAPLLAGIPERTGFFGEVRLGLLTDIRFGKRRLPRMIDQYGSLALPKRSALPKDWPLPQLRVDAGEIAAWRQRHQLQANPGQANFAQARPVIALGPGSEWPSKRWSYYAEAARALNQRGFDVWIIGGPKEKQLASEIVAFAGPNTYDLTSNDLRNGVIALAAAQLAISNDSGLMHIAAAVGTPTVAIFGPTSAQLWAPLNPIAALIETVEKLPCQPCQQKTCGLQHHLCMRSVSSERVVAAVEHALAHPDERVRASS